MEAQTSANTITTTKEESPLARANRVAGAVNLEHVRFVQFNGSSLVSREKLVDDETTDYSVGYTRPKFQRVPEGFLISSTLVFSLDRKAIEGDTPQPAHPIAALRATIELTYKLKAETETPALSDEDVTAFANINVPFNSWGYWREFVQSGLARLGVTQSVVLPLFRVQTAREWMIEDETLATPERR